MEADAAICTIEPLTKELPPHTVRSEAQIAFQQFSTSARAGLSRGSSFTAFGRDVFPQLSAGTGIIASLAQGVAKTSVLKAPEPNRADLLEGISLNRRCSGTMVPSLGPYRRESRDPVRWL